MTEAVHNMIMLDDIDRKIISLLQYNGRLQYTEIAEKVPVNDATVRRRVNHLVDSGILQIVGIVEPHNLGWNEAGMIAITTQPDRTEEVANAISQLREVSYLFQVAGEFDLFIEVFCHDKEEFVNFLNDKLQKIPGIRETRSFIILKMYKLSYRWGEADPPSQINDE